MSQQIEYYSQCQQDRILDKTVFKHVKNGVFVDVGAHDGVKVSNTLTFEKYYNWSGICIEALPDIYNELKRNRSCVCLNYAISTDAKPKALIKVNQYAAMFSGLNEDPKHLQRIAQEVIEQGGSIEFIVSKCETLEKIFETHQVKHIQYLSVDVEGGESQVMHSINFDKVFIDVIDLNTSRNDSTHPIVSYLESKGFFLYRNIQLDVILMHKDSTFNPKLQTSVAVAVVKPINLKSTRRQFHKYLNSVLIESGSHTGDGIAEALEAGFHTVYSYEVGQYFYDLCKEKFKGNENVHLILGSSAKMSSQIEQISCPITFWLDGHWSGGKTSYEDVYCPLLLELDEIAKHPIKTHTILIDDRRMFDSIEMNGISEQMLKDRILQINPNYKFFYEDGYVANDILVAVVRESVSIRPPTPTPEFDFPVLIIAFNNFTYVKNMIQQLRSLTIKKIIVVDNGSTYKPLLDFYKHNRVQQWFSLIEMNKNHGHRVVVDQLSSVLPDVFVVTDPDLQMSPKTPRDFLSRFLDISRRHQAGKVGVALDISANEKFRDNLTTVQGQTIREWESQFWRHRLTDPTYELYDAAVDTTFALYNKQFSQSKHIRVAGDFVAKHLPWYIEDQLPEDEKQFYLNSANCASWYKCLQNQPINTV